MKAIDINRIAIIGAGPAGICAARHLYHNKYNDKKFDIVIYERQKQIGGLWNYNKTNNIRGKNTSPIYKDMITNLPKQVTYFPDFPYPENYPTFMHHSLVLKYLQEYAKDSCIEHLVRFDTDVTTVSPLLCNGRTVEDGKNGFIKWQVESKDLRTCSSQTEDFDAVLVCNGINWKPFLLHIEGSQYFKGNILHSSSYDDPMMFKNQNVVVYGYGPSAIDLIIILSKVSKNVYISKRTEGLFKGNHPSNVTVVANVRKINKNGGIELDDNSTLDADAMILCTGYSLSYPFLSKDCKVGFEENDKILMPIYKHLFNAIYPSMAFISLANLTIMFSLIYHQSAYIAAIFSGHKQLPTTDEMLKDIEKEKIRTINDGKPLGKFHHLGYDSFEYANELAELSETEKLPKTVDICYKALFQSAFTDFYTMKLKDYSKM